jgi:ATP-dependent Clp protease adaptor protein ClpS
MARRPGTQQHTKPQTKDPSEGVGVRVILYNCECHTFDSVITQLMRAIGCTHAAARRFAYLIHLNGQATVYTGTQEACDTVADVLADIGLRVRVV